MTGMRGALRTLALLGLAAAVLAGGCFLWNRRPWRPAVVVNGRILSVGELDLRARALLDDARRGGNRLVAPDREEEAWGYYRRRAAKMWIVKEVLLAEALARGYVASPADEKASLAQIAARLKSRQLTPEQFFREGPLSEETKRRDFREGVLIDKLTAREVRDRITVSTKEVDARLADLRRAASAQAKPGAAAPPPPTRRQALNALRVERFRVGFRKFFEDLYVKASVTCPAYPDLETLDGISPRRKTK